MFVISPASLFDVTHQRRHHQRIHEHKITSHARAPESSTMQNMAAPPFRRILCRLNPER